MNNLRLIENGCKRELTKTERDSVFLAPFKLEKLTYKQLRKQLKDAVLAENYTFAGLSYNQLKKLKDPESATFVNLKGWHALKSAFKKGSETSLWEQISTAALEGKPQLLDTIAWVLSVYKEDTEVEAELGQLNLPDPKKCIPILQGVSFDKFSNLSLKALYKITPHMKSGLRYDEAVAQIPEYGSHSQPASNAGVKQKFLPLVYAGRDEHGKMHLREEFQTLTNPVVLRAMNQTCKVVNALIKEYGNPTDVHIEMARDLAKSFDEREAIQKGQTIYRDKRINANKEFEAALQSKPDGRQLEKYLLYREQNGKCAYSLKAMGLHDLVRDSELTEIDHILPESRSFDNSQNNKVLVYCQENQRKGNRTPYEYLTSFSGGEDGDRWKNFLAYVESNKSFRNAKKNRLLRRDFDDQNATEFKERNLNDTRYVCRLFKNHLEKHLQLDGAAGQCVVINGQLTAFLRTRWGLIKNRKESVRHHALDAAVIAACSRSMVNSLANYARANELKYVQEGFTDPETGEIINAAAFKKLGLQFPKPWEHFREELLARINVDDAQELQEQLRILGTYNEQALAKIKPLFVSRAPKRLNHGSAHKETLYAKAPCPELPNRVKEKKWLDELKIKDLDRMVDQHRNQELIDALSARLRQFADEGKKAFAEPFYKLTKDKSKPAPLVRKVTLYIDKQTGIDVRKGLAANDHMARVDVFHKPDGRGKFGKGFYLVPVYESQRGKQLPNHAIISKCYEKDWLPMDESCHFLFSLYPNDLVEITQKDKTLLGYYNSCDRASANLTLWAHDSARVKEGNGQMRGVGVKTALAIKKLNVDLLGKVYLAKKTEVRHGLA